MLIFYFLFLFEKKMLNSQWIKVETPNSDALRLFRTWDEVQEFLDNNGAPTAIVDGNGIVRVPAWASGIQKYSDLKQAHCNRYGCN